MEKSGELLHLSIDDICPNPENPRLIFDQDKLDILSESISEVGILVPLIVYKDDDGKYILLDGERRWRCARRLNFKKVPANIIAKPNKIENILRMFNIHNVREEWELMPTAWKLGELIELLDVTSERRLSELTSLKVGTIRRCRTLLSLPKRYQKALLNREIKADFFIEMDAKVLKKIEKILPEFFNKYGREGLMDKFVEMLNLGMIKSVTDFRLFQKVLQAEKFGLSLETIESLAKRVIIDHEMNFEEAYTAIEDLENLSKIDQKASQLSTVFSSFDYKKLKKSEKEKLKSTLIELKHNIEKILENL